MSLRDINIDFEENINVLLGEIVETSKQKKDTNQQRYDRRNQTTRKIPPDDEEKQEDCFDYLYLGNIPTHFKSADLRFFFFSDIEKGVFKCFHYRHRPETQQIISNNLDSTHYNENKSNVVEQASRVPDTISRSCCCIIKCYKKNSSRIINKYNTKEWRSSTLKFTKTRVNLRSLKISLSEKDNNHMFRSKRELISDRYNSDNELSLQDIKQLLEMNPPIDVMPNGNVGTSTNHFQKMISECRLPCSVIKKLGINFPKNTKKNRQYSSVHLDYEINSNKFQNRFSSNGSSAEGTTESESKIENHEEDHDAEEWDRYEALHDDVDNQARPKERLFEENLEVKWEKGGSGLVFYTDAYFWNEMKGKDFDEDTVDDWDVDYSVYYEDDAGDKPARDHLKMRLEKRRRQGKKEGPSKYSDILHGKRNEYIGFAEFEKYTTAFGSRILKKQGWKNGDGVGSEKQGIKEPVNLVGQSPKKHVGLGFYGEKLDRSVSLKREALRDVYISTVYDDKDGEEMDAMRFHGLDLLKYRTPKVDFLKPEKSS